MIPYADFLYFGILLYIALPTLLIRRWLGFSRAWVVLVTAAMLIVQYGTIVHVLPLTTSASASVTEGFSVWGGLAEVRTLWVVMACGIFQWIVAQSFLWMRTLMPLYAALSRERRVSSRPGWKLASRTVVGSVSAPSSQATSSGTSRAIRDSTAPP